MIESLNIKNFTVFEDVKINFSPKINVIIGENGTGKSHLLKLIYALCSANKDTKFENIAQTVIVEKLITYFLSKLFLPLDGKLWKLRTTNSVGSAAIQADFSNDNHISFDFNVNSKTVGISNLKLDKTISSPVFIPPKEVLSFMKGFSSLYEKYDLTFDKTYYDIILLLNLPEVRKEHIQEKANWAIEEIEKICGGRFIFQAGGNVIFKTNDTDYSINAIAEGFRKIGILSQLLKTGAIEPGISGPLLWDEPESNMNPKLLKFIVQVLIELSRNGQQIIVSTHDYVVLKWFDLLINKEKDDHIKYHIISKDENNKIIINSFDEYSDIGENAISKTFSDLYDEEITRALGRKC